MRCLPVLHARYADFQSAYDYLRIPDGWDRWVSLGVVYEWRSDVLHAIDQEGRVWKFDPFRELWVHVVEVAA